MSDELSDSLETAAQKPKKAEVDGRSAEAHPLPDVIAADQYLRGRSALAGGRSALAATRPARIIPPGTTGPCSE